ncbi:MAG: Trp family transcriptional regulator, partial [Candidatus Woesebacteria bacterium]|nr:Trp family transcriptional regulator [Candidatus Woesebacteria bacterium]
VWERIFDLFGESILSIKNRKELNGFLEDFLSPTERIMLAKRFAITVLLSKGRDYRSISTLLRVTPSTIAKMNLLMKYSGTGLIPVVERILKRDTTKIIWEEIKSLLDVPIKGLPLSEFEKKKIKRSQKIRKLRTEI